MKLCRECNQLFKEEELDNCPDDALPLLDVGNDPLIGQLIGDKYRILCQAGEGSMSVVYKAVQESTGRDMAVKMLHKFLGAKEDLVRRFFREAKAVSSLHHTNIIKLYDFGVMPDEQPYIVTEYLDGINLSQLLRKRNRLTVKEALPLIEQMCAGIAEAHRKRVIHRDLKPDNIVLQDIDPSKPPDSKDLIGQNCVRVVDFGVAKLWGSETAALTLEGKVCGSPAYMSPEQCKGADIDFRTDIYSIGVVLFEVFSGRRPFLANDLMALMLMHVNKEAPTLSQAAPEITFPPGLSSIVARALNKNPDDRFKCVEDLWYEIEAVCTFRKERKPLTVKSSQEWILFEDSGASKILMPSGPTRQFQRTPKPASHQVNENTTATTSQLPSINRARKGSPAFRFGQLKGIVFLAVLVVSVFSIIDLFSKMTGVNSARALMAAGNYEGCIQILETINSSKSLSRDDKNLLNRAYLELARKRAGEAKPRAATSLLKKIDKHSFYYKQAQEMRSKIK